jgi:hypothetical protein
LSLIFGRISLIFTVHLKRLDLQAQQSVYQAGGLFMMKNQSVSNPHDHSAQLPLDDLRKEWQRYWGIDPHARIGRALLEKSLTFKLRELEGKGLSEERRRRLHQLITAYKRNPKFFSQGPSELKPGVRLVKTYKGEHHSVMVLAGGFEYRDKRYSSLSEIAGVITGTRWNGWVFFGLKNRGEKP